MNESNIRETIRQYITTQLMRDDEYTLSNTEGIITEGLIDSFSLADLAVFVESQFDVYIPDPDLTVAKMNTLDQIVARVLRV